MVEFWSVVAVAVSVPSSMSVLQFSSYQLNPRASLHINFINTYLEPSLLVHMHKVFENIVDYHGCLFLGKWLATFIGRINSKLASNRINNHRAQEYTGTSTLC